MIITRDLLENMPSGHTACNDALEWMEGNRLFGADWEIVWSECPDSTWKVWFAVNYLPLETAVSLCLRFVGQAFRYAAIENKTLAPFADNVTMENINDAQDAALQEKGQLLRKGKDASALTAAIMCLRDCDRFYFFGSAAMAATVAAMVNETGEKPANIIFQVSEEQAQWCQDALRKNIKENMGWIFDDKPLNKDK